MNDLTPIVTRTEELRPTAPVAPVTREAPAEKPSREPINPPLDIDHIKLSFDSQARLLRQQGQNTEEIALNLGATRHEVVIALQKAGVGMEPLTELQDLQA